MMLCRYFSKICSITSILNLQKMPLELFVTFWYMINALNRDWSMTDRKYFLVKFLLLFLCVLVIRKFLINPVNATYCVIVVTHQLKFYHTVTFLRFYFTRLWVVLNAQMVFLSCYFRTVTLPLWNALISPFLCFIAPNVDGRPFLFAWRAPYISVLRCNN